jgi:hypothetical protein
VGYGSVTIPVQTPGSDDFLRVTDVLHVPEIPWNVLGSSALDQCTMFFESEEKKPDDGALGELVSFRGNSKGISVALLEAGPGNLSRESVLRLSDYPIGPETAPERPSSGNAAVSVLIAWPDEMKEDCFEQRLQHEFESRDRDRVKPLTTLTTEERGWLKKHYNDEFRFLFAYGLSIYNINDRHEGRAILQTLVMQNDTQTKDDADGSEQDTENSPKTSVNVDVKILKKNGNIKRQKLKDIFQDKEKRRLADDHFSQPLLAHVNELWGSTLAYMYHLGPDVFNELHGRIAV